VEFTGGVFGVEWITGRVYSIAGLTIQRNQAMNERGFGEIRPDSAYTAREFCRRTGISFHRLREYLPVRRLAGRTYVLGSDLIAALGPPEKRPKRDCPFQVVQPEPGVVIED
jgi:hypothetical protein